jgi:hypothetical protein
MLYLSRRILSDFTKLPPFFSQNCLSDDQIRSFSFFFPRCPFVVSKHCAIVCLKPGLSLDSTQVLLDERCVVATIKDAQHNVLCRAANIYGLAQSSAMLVSHYLIN